MSVWFKRGWVFLLLLMIGGTALASGEGKKQQGSIPESKKAAAVIQIDENTYHFGQVSEGEVVRHDFTVLNKGDAVLEIKSVKPG
jgi:hypothetical protein